MASAQRRARIRRNTVSTGAPKGSFYTGGRKRLTTKGISRGRSSDGPSELSIRLRYSARGGLKLGSLRRGG